LGQLNLAKCRNPVRLALSVVEREKPEKPRSDSWEAHTVTVLRSVLGGCHSGLIKLQAEFGNLD